MADNIREQGHVQGRQLKLEVVDSSEDSNDSVGRETFGEWMSVESNVVCTHCLFPSHVFSSNVLLTDVVIFLRILSSATVCIISCANVIPCRHKRF